MPQVAPILQEIANEHGDKLEIVKLNIDENPEVPREPACSRSRR